MIDAPPPTDKRKFSRASALAVTRVILAELIGCTERVLVAGSLRRGKEMVGDIEILFVPKIVTAPDPEDMLGATKPLDLADAALNRMLASGMIHKRIRSDNRATWGGQLRFAVHTETEVPIDFFVANENNWWNLVVCRTGPADSNIAICNAAIAMGWKWEPYTEGYCRMIDDRKDTRTMHSEQDVFRFVNLPYRAPTAR